MEWYWWIGGAVLAFASFMTRMYFAERTKRRKPSDQLISLCDLNKRCKEQKQDILNEVEGEMTHVKEMIEKDLEGGRKRFEELGAMQKETTKALTNLTTEIRLLQQARNGKDATTPSHP